MNGNIARELDSGAWNHPNPVLCECKGRGWILSDFDTWHQCKIHGKDVPHPEWEYEEGDFDAEEHRLTVMRDAYNHYRGEARRAGFTGNFKEACRTRLETSEPSSEDWVAAAYEIADGLAYAREEALAKTHGYSCGLEMRFAQEAEREHAERWQH